MTIQEKLETLTSEQREKLSTVKTERELDAFLAESGIEPTAEERAILSEHLKAKNGELTDDELEAAAGGGNLTGIKCVPHGHFELTGIANIFGTPASCEVNVCPLFQRSAWAGGFKAFGKTYSVYNEKCFFFDRTMERKYTTEKPSN